MKPPRGPAAAAKKAGELILRQAQDDRLLKPELVRLARGEDFRLFLLWLFDFFLLTVVAFTHDELLVWWL